MPGGYAAIPEYDWVPFTPNAAVAAHAAMKVTGTTTLNGEVVYQTRQYQAGAPPKTVLINGPQDVASGSYGMASTAMGHPMAALCSESSGIVGPSHNSWTLTTAHPGFFVLGAGAVSGTAMVLRVCSGTKVKGLAVGAVAGTSPFNIDNVSTMTGLEVVENSSSTVSIVNTFTDTLDDNGVVTATYNETDTQWETDDVACPA